MSIWEDHACLVRPQPATGPGWAPLQATQPRAGVKPALVNDGSGGGYDNPDDFFNAAEDWFEDSYGKPAPIETRLFPGTGRRTG